MTTAPTRQPGHWTPHWSRPVTGVTAAVSCRHGGTSAPPYATLNLGFHVLDDPEDVRENRRRFGRDLGVGLARAIQPRLVHGTRVEVVDRTLAGRGGAAPDEPFAADGLVTATPGLPLLVTVADCMPVFLAATEGRAVGLVHAGWRGLVDGVVPAAVTRLREDLGVPPEDLAVAVGPCIGPCCFEVSAELGERFRREFGDHVVHDGKDPEHAQVDLHGALAGQLKALGVTPPAERPPCTACHTDRFFSHRAEGGRTGRMLGVLAISG